MRVTLHAAVIVSACLVVGCTEPTSHRNPSRFASLPPAKTLLTAALKCGESHEVAAGGMLVKRATDFGAMAVVRLDARIERIGDSAPAIPRRYCAGLVDDGAISARSQRRRPHEAGEAGLKRLARLRPGPRPQ